VNQLADLERRTGASGRDSVDHRRGQHDDVANAAAGALVIASQAIGLRATLPPTFTSCNRAASGLPLYGGDGVCIYSGGRSRPVDGCPTCGSCEAHKAVKAALTAHRQRTGEGIDLIQFFRQTFALPEHIAYRALVRESEDALGFG
jgi:hypothetical protein